MSKDVLVGKALRRPWRTRVALAGRWVHIYLSLFGLMAVLFFGVTGITLNHPDWFFADALSFTSTTGEVNADWVNQDELQKLEVVEHLREAHGIRGALSDFSVDDYECAIYFKGAGYSADIFLDRETGRYTLTESRAGFVAVMNDLHKGRDTGPVWSMVIDIVAVLLTVVSLSGLLLMLYLKRRRRQSLIVMTVGTGIFVLLYVLALP